MNLTSFTLSNGVVIPSIGYGTYRLEGSSEGSSVDVAKNSVTTALRVGCRHIDAAAVYGNETSVGAAIRESGIDRKELFITSKVWNTERGYDKTMAAFDKSLADLGLDYLDLYLIHWPAAQGTRSEWQQLNASTWSALEKLYKDGRVRAIGVSNFLSHHLIPLMSNAQVQPMVNQIEYHPGFVRRETVEFCHQNHIQLEAWSPLGRGRVLALPLLIELAEKYGAESTAQVIIRWCLQNSVIPLPKSESEARIRANINVMGFDISDEDMQRISNLPTCGFSGLEPDSIDF